MAIARACLPNVSPERCELIVDRGERKGPLDVRVPSCFPVERYGELHGFFEVSWIDENVLSLDHDLYRHCRKSAAKTFMTEILLALS